MCILYIFIYTYIYKFIILFNTRLKTATYFPINRFLFIYLFFPTNVSETVTELCCAAFTPPWQWFASGYRVPPEEQCRVQAKIGQEHFWCLVPLIFFQQYLLLKKKKLLVRGAIRVNSTIWRRQILSIDIRPDDIRRHVLSVLCTLLWCFKRTCIFFLLNMAKIFKCFSNTFIVKVKTRRLKKYHEIVYIFWIKILN